MQPFAMQMIDWSGLDAAGRRAALARPPANADAAVVEQARRIVARVRAGGDGALRELSLEFDGARLDGLRVGEPEFEQARESLPPEAIAALQVAIGNVSRFHLAQAPSPISIETQPGVRCERLPRPIRAVGLYVPAGSAPLPSTAIMLAVPAQIARSPVRVLCTPARRDGQADPAVLVAARMCGVTHVYKVGGAQAIAAMAYGTETIPKVDKVFGPGNRWVTAAKQLVAADAAGAALDMPAGPSEVMVIADDSADAEFVATDLLAQAEHDPGAQAILVCAGAGFATRVAERVRDRAARLPRRAILEQSLAAARLISVASLDAAIEIAEAYAPEHLVIETRAPRELLARIGSAGSVFLGRWSPEPMGDYCSGTNHVLPTFGHARAYGGLSVQDFMRGMTVQELSAEGLRALGPTAVTLARLEGLEAHAEAVEVRLAALAEGRDGGTR